MIPVVRVDSRDMERELTRMSRQLNRHRSTEVNRILSRVINRNLATIKRRVIKKAAVSMQIKQKTLRPRVVVVKAKASHLSGRVWVGLNPITAQSAGAKPADEGYKLGPYQWPNAFSNAKLNNGIFERKGRARLPIKKVAFGEAFVGPTLTRITNAESRDNLDNDFRIRLFVELDKAMMRILS